MEVVCFSYKSREPQELLALAVAVEELINTTCGINELVLASVEWVAS